MTDEVPTGRATSSKQLEAITIQLTSVGLLFLRLGATAFGGPAVYIAMMRDEAVSRRRWLSDAHFLDRDSLAHCR